MAGWFIYICQNKGTLSWLPGNIYVDWLIGGHFSRWTWISCNAHLLYFYLDYLLTECLSAFWILLELRMMEVVSGNNWSYRSCKAPVKSSPTNQHQVFLQARCPSCRPAISARALKGNQLCALLQMKKITSKS